MDALCMQEKEDYQVHCGEVYFRSKGRLIFHCTLCENNFQEFSMYESHLKDHLVPYFDDDEKYDSEQYICEDVDEMFEDQSCDISSEEMESSVHNEYLEEGIDFEDENIEHTENLKTTNPVEKNISSKIIKLDVPEVCDVQKRKFDNLNYKNRNKENAENLNEEKSMLKLVVTTENKPQEVIEITRKVRKGIYSKSLLIPEEQRKYKCPVCNAGFKEKHNMHHHLKRHTNKKDFKCPECDKSFYFSYEVRIHLKSHSNDRPFLCNICGNSYAHNGKLLAHLRRHSGQRNINCELCDKSFFERSELKRHMISHSSDRPYACEICGADFRRPKTLENHLKIHENKKEFKCKICDARFNQQAGLSSHKCKNRAHYVEEK